jgi:MerR family transcriptional regulator, heat shock protein HspR
MTMDHYEIIISNNRRQLWELADLALAADVHPQLVEYFVEYGLLEPVERIGTKLFFACEAIPRLKTIQRLRTEVGVNLPGIAIILDLTGKVQELQQELEWLKIKVGI